jgi:MFS family permease
MLGAYLHIFRVPGSRAFVAAGFVSRFSMSMTNLATVLLISQLTGQYAIAGFLVAMSSMIYAFASPRWSGLADRHGQSWVLVRATPIYVGSLLLFILLVQLSAPVWTWFVAFAFSAATAIQTGSMVRRRWHYLLGDDKDGLHTAWSLESVLDEVVFIVGPVLATLLSIQVHPTAGLFAVMALVGGGSLWLNSLKSSEPSSQRREGEHSAGAILRIPGMAPIMVVLFFLGGYFVAIDLLAIAYADEQGARSLTGVILACWAFGSGVSGLLFGAIKWKNTATERMLYSAIGLSLLTTPLLLVNSLWTFTLVLFLSGWAISPTLVSAYAIVERLVIDSRVTEAISWSITGIVLGSAAMAAVAGRMIDAIGAQRSFILAVAPALMAVAILVFTRRGLAARVAA